MEKQTRNKTKPDEADTVNTEDELFFFLKLVVDDWVKNASTFRSTQNPKSLTLGQKKRPLMH